MQQFIPKSYRPQQKDWMGNPIAESYDYPVNIGIVKKYFHLTDNPKEADCPGLIESPNNTLRAATARRRQNGGNGYIPISLQYEPYGGIFGSQYCRG